MPVVLPVVEGVAEGLAVPETEAADEREAEGDGAPDN